MLYSIFESVPIVMDELLKFRRALPLGIIQMSSPARKFSIAYVRKDDRFLRGALTLLRVKRIRRNISIETYPTMNNVQIYINLLFLRIEQK